MADFFMGLSTALGWGPAGIYVALGVVCLGITAGVVAGVYAYKRKKNLNQGVGTKAKNKVKDKLGKEKDGEITKTKVRDDKKFNDLLKKQPENVTKTASNEAGEEKPKTNLKNIKKNKKVSETTEFPDFSEDEEEIEEVVQLELEQEREK